MVYTPKAVKEAKKDEEVEDEVDIDIASNYSSEDADITSQLKTSAAVDL